MRKRFGLVVLFLFLCGALSASADEVRILAVDARAEAASLVKSYAFSVTLEHKDEGWKHFANLWEVYSADGKNLLGKRILAHPHVDEQPFTRSLNGVVVPEGTTQVMIRAYDSVHGESPQSLLVDLPE